MLNAGSGGGASSNYCAEVLKITPSIVIGKVMGPTGNLLYQTRMESQDAMGEPEETQSAGSLVIGIVPKSLENRK